MNGRYPATEGRKDIDALDTPPLDGVKLAEVDGFRVVERELACSNLIDLFVLESGRVSWHGTAGRMY